MKCCQKHREQKHEEMIEATYQEVLKEKDYYLNEVFDIDMSQDQEDIDSDFENEAKEYALELDTPAELDEIMKEDGFVCDCYVAVDEFYLRD